VLIEVLTSRIEDAQANRACGIARFIDLGDDCCAWGTCREFSAWCAVGDVVNDTSYGGDLRFHIFSCAVAGGAPEVVVKKQTDRSVRPTG
jgi:hypothetical protein